MKKEDIRKLVKSSGYSDEEIDEMEEQVIARFGAYLTDENLLWRKIALELGVTISDDVLTGRKVVKKVSVEEFTRPKKIVDKKASFELEGVFFDVRDDYTSNGKKCVSYRFVDKTGIVTGKIYSDLHVKDKIEELMWYRVVKAGQYMPVDKMLMTVGKYTDFILQKGKSDEYKIENTYFGMYDGDFDFMTTDWTKRFVWVRGLVTQEEINQYYGCKKCNHGFEEEDDECKNKKCDGNSSETGTDLFFHRLKIRIGEELGAIEATIGPSHANGKDTYIGNIIEAVCRGYCNKDGEDCWDVLGIRVLAGDMGETVRVKQKREKMEKAIREDDRSEWSDAMKDLYDALGDGKVHDTDDIIDMLDGKYSKREIVTASSRLESRLGVIEYPEFGKFRRMDVELDEEPEKESKKEPEKESKKEPEKESEKEPEKESEKEPDKESEDEYVCDECGKSYQTEGWLDRHMETKHGAKPKAESETKEEVEEGIKERSDESSYQRVAEDMYDFISNLGEAPKMAIVHKIRNNDMNEEEVEKVKKILAEMEYISEDAMMYYYKR